MLFAEIFNWFTQSSACSWMTELRWRQTLLNHFRITPGSFYSLIKLSPPILTNKFFVHTYWHNQTWILDVSASLLSYISPGSSLNVSFIPDHNNHTNIFRWLPTFTHIPHPIHSSSLMYAILSVGVTSIQSLPMRTTGHDFLHSWRHLLGLHLSAFTMAILVSLSAMTSLRVCETQLSICENLEVEGGSKYWWE